MGYGPDTRKCCVCKTLWGGVKLPAPKRTWVCPACVKKQAVAVR